MAALLAASPGAGQQLDSTLVHEWVRVQAYGLVLREGRVTAITADTLFLRGPRSTRLLGGPLVGVRYIASIPVPFDSIPELWVSTVSRRQVRKTATRWALIGGVMMLAAPALLTLPDCGRLSCHEGEDASMYLVGGLSGAVLGGLVGGIVGYFDIRHEGWQRVELRAQVALDP